MNQLTALLQFVEFSEKLLMITPEILDILKPWVIANHGQERRYDYSGDQPTETHTPRDIHSIQVSPHFIVNRTYDFATNQLKTEYSILLSFSTYAGNTSISDGNFYKAFHDLLKDKMDLSPYTLLKF